MVAVRGAPGVTGAEDLLGRLAAVGALLPVRQQGRIGAGTYLLQRMRRKVVAPDQCC